MSDAADALCERAEMLQRDAVELCGMGLFGAAMGYEDEADTLVEHAERMLRESGWKGRRELGDHGGFVI